MVDYYFLSIYNVYAVISGGVLSFLTKLRKGWFYVSKFSVKGGFEMDLVLAFAWITLVTLYFIYSSNLRK